MKTLNKVAIVTGASSGIGLATARLLAQNGYKVYGFSRRQHSGSADVISLAVDVTKPATIDQAVAQVLEAEGRIDLLVNNAGVFLLGAVEESSMDQARALFETNLFGLMQVTRAVLPTMRKQASGRIINMSSVLGFIPSVYGAIYGATKHAVEGYTESLDHEIRPLGIRALLVEPAITRTELSSPAPETPLPAYATVRSRMEVFMKQGFHTGDTAEVVAEVVLRAAEDKNPKLRYPASSRARQLAILRRFLPARAFDRVFRKSLRLDAA